MKHLADALRTGSEGMRHIQGAMFAFEGEKLVGCCAVGAIIRGLGYPTPEDIGSLEKVLQQAAAEHPELYSRVREPNQGKPMLLQFATISLNDGYRWTFERIASWLEALTEAA